MSEKSKHMYKFGVFRLDESEKALWREGTRIHLPPKVFDTLLALVQKSGQIADKEYLLNRVWPETFVEENNLNKTISAVRRALGDSERHESVETVPKRGYIFSADVQHVSRDTFALAVGTIPETPLANEEFRDSKDSRPTLILSSYLPEDIRGGLARDSSHHPNSSKRSRLIYRDCTEGDSLIVRPNDPYLDIVRNGGDLWPVNYWHSPWAKTFAFPTLDIKLVNNTDKTLFFHEVVLRVRRSRLDPRPIPIINGTGYMKLPLYNIGWDQWRIPHYGSRY